MLREKMVIICYMSESTVNSNYLKNFRSFIEKADIIPQSINEDSKIKKLEKLLEESQT